VGGSVVVIPLLTVTVAKTSGNNHDDLVFWPHFALEPNTASRTAPCSLLRHTPLDTVSTYSSAVGPGCSGKSHFDLDGVSRYTNFGRCSSSEMSTSTFHHHFRALTAKSPLQYQKWLRLNEARRLMLTEDQDATTAAFEVGYESPSQFSREYSRLFGNSPLWDIANLRQMSVQEVT
jgi:hypothetical protein